jgi:hypothetical protein
VAEQPVRRRRVPVRTRPPRAAAAGLIARRFIPLEKWPLIVLSLFAIHNETRACSCRARPAAADGAQ